MISVFRPKHTFKSVLQELSAGLSDGTIIVGEPAVSAVPMPRYSQEVSARQAEREEATSRFQEMGSESTRTRRVERTALIEQENSGHESLGSWRVASRPLADKVVFVTGGSRVIGGAICRELSGRGATVAINFHQNFHLAETLRDEIRQFGEICEAFQGDASNPDEARTIIQDVIDRFNRIDVLINTADTTRDHTIRKMTNDDWQKVIETNLSGAFYCIREVVPGMIQQRYGRIVNIASFCGQSGMFGQSNYSASSGGIIAMTKALALELAKYNITVNVIAAGITNSEPLDTIPGDIVRQLIDRIPLHRFAEPEEVARAAAFLICDGDYITGHQLNVNGGIYM